MGRFEFRSRELELDIAGVKFALEVDDYLIELIADKGRDMQDLAQSMDEELKGGKSAGDIISKAISGIKAIIDEILGEGASRDIFDGRAEDFYDCTDVFKYIADEVNGFVLGRASGYLEASGVANKQRGRAARRI